LGEDGPGEQGEKAKGSDADLPWQRKGTGQPRGLNGTAAGLAAHHGGGRRGERGAPAPAKQFVVGEESSTAHPQ